MRARISPNPSLANARAISTVRTFIRNRMDDVEVLNWAMSLRAADVAERSAIQQELEFRSHLLGPVWREAWHLLVESWEVGGSLHHHDSDEYHINTQVTSGDRSGLVIKRIVELVRPVMTVQRGSISRKSRRGRRTSPRVLSQLVTVSVEARHPFDPKTIGIHEIEDVGFLSELGAELTFAIERSQRLGSRVDIRNWEWRIGYPRRVRYIDESMRPNDEHEPDEFSTGIAGAAKLLFAVVGRISEISRPAAQSFISSWRSSGDDLRLRMWAEVARDPLLITAADAFEFLSSRTLHEFWSLDVTPEYSWLRAARFSEMTQDQQTLLLRRIKKGPPRRFWSRAPRDEVDRAIRYRAAMETRRIEVAGGMLPPRVERWYRQIVQEIPEILQINQVDEGDWGLQKARWVEPQSGLKFDGQSGGDLLLALEEALTANARRWNEEPRENARDWIRGDGRQTQLIDALEQQAESGDSFPKVWGEFAWSHASNSSSPKESTVDVEPSLRVLELILVLDDKTCSQAISGLSAWMDSWASHLAYSDKYKRVWLKLWPIAADATNADEKEGIDPLNTSVRGGDADSPGDLDALNTPAGRMVGGFLSCCPPALPRENPFERDPLLAEMREACVSARGRAGVVALYRLIQGPLEYLLTVDPFWTRERVLSHLLQDSRSSLVLWRAMAWKRRFHSVVGVLGQEMLLRALDGRLGREARSTLAISLALEMLHSFNERRKPGVTQDSVTQMLRATTEEVREAVARMLGQFVKHMGNPPSGKDATKSVEELFTDSVEPFLTSVWPQEATLSSPGVSKGFSALPAECGSKFSEAAETVLRFLVPFDSWSLHDYGLGWGDRKDIQSVVDTPEKGASLLRLLDATVSGADGIPVPRELDQALEAIVRMDSRASRGSSYRRLAALTRR